HYLVAQHPERDPYEVLVEHASKEPSRVLALPHLVGSGTPWIDPHSKAAFVGITLATREGEVIRAILESVVFEQRLNVGCFESQGVTFREIRVTGGCSRSPLWLQIRADIFGKPVVTLQCEDASVLGAAILASWGSGAYRSLEEAAQNMVKVKSVWTPDKERHKLYEERFQVYRDLYAALKDIHHCLA
ncbi:MAG: xylulokinase, partial [Candidatus Caldatribacteriaceae bacterium]